MGTETLFGVGQVYHNDGEAVKLNNPLMGTET